MHYLSPGDYTHLAGEINALYHQAAVEMGLSDSAMNILYVLWESGDRCPQSRLSHLTGISRQTIHSALRKLEKEGVVACQAGPGRTTQVCLTPQGRAFAQEKLGPLFAIENQIWNQWTPEEQQQYLTLTRQYCQRLKEALARRQGTPGSGQEDV